MTLEELYQKCVQIIGSASDTPTLDARIIAQNVLNIELNSFILHFKDIVSPADCQTITDLAIRRTYGEPVAYLVGHRGFYEDDFKVNQYTLIPRADTETLVELAIELAKQKTLNLSILDLCCGTGCIGISTAKALAKQGKNVELTLTDLSLEAMDVCKENARKILGDIGIEYKFGCGDLFESVACDEFDMILTNPPYIASGVIGTLEEQVKREPILALDGGEDGLDLIREITSQAPNYLKKDGYLLMEIGYDQGAAVKKLFEKAGFKEVEVKKDLGGRDRVVKGHIR